MAEPTAPATEQPTGEGTDGVSAAIARRHLVPSRREQGLGVAVSDYRWDEVGDQGEKVSFRRGLAEFARAADPRDIEGSKLPLLLISLLAFNTGLDVSAIANLQPEIQASFGLDLSFLATFTLISAIMLQLLGPLTGYLADRVRRVWMLRVGGLISGIAFLLQGVVPSTGMLVGSRITGGLGGAVSAPASYPLLADYFRGAARARVFAVFGLFTALGTVVGPTVSGQLATYFGWRTAVVVIGVFATSCALFTWGLKEPKRGYLDRLDMGATEEQAAHEQKPISFAEGWRAASSIATLRKLWYATPFLVVILTVQQIVLPSYYAAVFQLDPGQRGFLISAGAIVGLGGLAFSGPVADRLLAVKPGRVFTLAGLLFGFSAINLAVLGLSPWLWLSFGVSLPFAFVAALISPALLTLVSIVVPARVRGLGIQSQAPFQVIGYVLFLLLEPYFFGGSIRNAFIICIPLALIAAVIVTSAAPGVERDIRAALAASMAEEEAARAKASGRNKMVICRDVDVTYDGVQVLFNVDFDVEEGEIIALLGTNGAGKSTLLRAIAGIQEASNGAICLDGDDITHAPPHENAGRGVVMMPGGNAVFPTLSVDENLRTAGWMYRADEDYLAARMAEVLDLFPVLRDRLAQLAGNLSGGEQQMVGLAQAFLMKPRLLMIDELSLGLAPRVVDQLLTVLRAIHAQGTTVILVEQSLNVALTIAQRAVFMEKGEIRFSGPTAELMQRPDLIRAVFMGGGAAAGGSTTRRGAAHRHDDGAADTALRPVLAADGVSVSFGGVQALRHVDVTVGDNEIVGIIGPNGAGKTTLFDIISGFVQPTTGRVMLGDEDVTGMSPDGRARLGLARSFQNARLFPSLTVREAIAVSLEARAVKSAVLAALWTTKARKSERKIARRIDDLVELLSLDAYANKFVGELSTGTRRAVDVACIMAAEPAVLLLDEPSSGLAQAETEELGPVLVRVARDTGCGMLVIEHDLPLITSISDRLVAMELGATIVAGSPEEVVSNPQVLASYLAASEDVLARSDSAMATIAKAVGVATNGHHLAMTKRG